MPSGAGTTVVYLKAQVRFIGQGRTTGQPFPDLLGDFIHMLILRNGVWTRHIPNFKACFPRIQFELAFLIFSCMRCTEEGHNLHPS